MKEYAVDIMSVCEEVTGSQTLINIRRNGENLKYLFDCGYDFEKGLDNQKIITDKPDKVFITHAHTDHVALLPKLCKTYDGPIYASSGTKSLLGVSLDDTLSIQNGMAKSKGIPSLFSENDISKATSQVKTLKLLKRYEIDHNIFVTFIPNSHIPGSCCIFLEIQPPEYEQDKGYEIPNLNFFFTGDLKTKDNPFLDNTVIPEYILNKPMYIITESTYGGEGRDREKVFEKNIIEAVNKGKKVLVPSLSLGRAQQLMYEIKKMKEEGKIPSSMPIYVDGKLLCKYINKYRKKLDVLIKDFEPENTIYVNKKIRPSVTLNDEPYIIIASSGNASFGPSNEYVNKLLEDENALIHFTSFQPKDTLGRRLLEAEKGELITNNGQDRYIKADIKFTAEFSSHDEKQDIIDFILKFKDVKGVLVTHGEKDAREGIVSSLKEYLPSIDVFNFDPEKFIRINRLICGKMKRINSKLKLDVRSSKAKITKTGLRKKEKRENRRTVRLRYRI